MPRSISDDRYNYLEENAGFDYVLEENEGRNFTEFVVKYGGDVFTYRVYGNNPKDFMITEK